jgi:hypothetical protein
MILRANRSLSCFTATCRGVTSIIVALLSRSEEREFIDKTEFLETELNNYCIFLPSA